MNSSKNAIFFFTEFDTVFGTVLIFVMGTVVLFSFETSMYYTRKSNVINLTATVICNLKRY